MAMGLQTTFNLVDAYVIARLDPDVVGPSLGAIGICDQIAAIGSIISYGVSTATAAMLSQRHGRGDHAGVVRVAWQSMLVVGALSLLFAALGLFASNFVMRDLVGAKGQVATLGVEYLRVIVGGSFSIFMLLQLTSIQRALGSSKTPVALLVSSNVINLVLAVLLVYGPGDAPKVFSWGPPIAKFLHLPRMELLGAAWATVLARSVVLLPLLVVVERRFRLFRRIPCPLVDTKALSRLLAIAWPASVQFVVRILAMLLTHSLVARTFTTSQDQRATTALGVVFRLETLALFVSMGWGSAAQTFFGQNHGAGQSKRAYATGWLAFAYNSVLMVGLIWAFRIYGGDVVRFFDSETPVVDMSLGYLAIVAPSYFALGGGIVLGNTITAAGVTKMTLLIDFCVVALVQVPLSLLAVSGANASMPRLWWAVATTSAVSAVVYVVVYRGGSFLKREAL
jgi:putative MATE family efflux protein